MPDSKSSTERIVSAALQRPGGAISALPAPYRHHDIIRHMSGVGWSPAKIALCEQGFVTDTGRFVDRKSAWRIADAAGQISRLPGGVEGLLFSENLW
jgi:hypothetical protein